MLKGFSGYLQTDGYSAYNAVESVTRVGCWAHARRKWVDCFEGKKPVEGSQSEKAFAYASYAFAQGNPLAEEILVHGEAK